MMTEDKAELAKIAENMEVNGSGLVLRNLNDMKLAAQTFINSGLVPSHFNTGSKIIVALQAGAELGFKPWQSLNQLHVVNGKVGISSTAIGGLIRNSGKCKTMKQYYEGDNTDNLKAIIESIRTDDETLHRTEFSVSDAKTAQLWGKDNWAKYPKEMLMWRALSKHGRAFYGDVLSGFYTVDELAEIHPPDEQDMPHVPSREERKQAEEVKITDTLQLIQDKLNEFIERFLKHIEENYDVCLYPDQNGELIKDILSMFAEESIEEERDFGDIKSFDMSAIEKMNNHLELIGLSKAITEKLPKPFGEEECQTTPSKSLDET